MAQHTNTKQTMVTTHCATCTCGEQDDETYADIWMRSRGRCWFCDKLGDYHNDLYRYTFDDDEQLVCTTCRDKIIPQTAGHNG